MEFPWRCNVDTIAMDLKVSWEMSVKGSYGVQRAVQGHPEKAARVGVANPPHPRP